MRTLRTFLALFLAGLLASPATLAQDASGRNQLRFQEAPQVAEPQGLPWLRQFKRPDIGGISFANSGRIEGLLRAGRLYLGLNDALALALENNLDIESARLTPRIAQTDYLRAKAGGLLRGVPTTVRQGSQSALAQAAGGATGGVGGGTGAGGAGAQTGDTTTTAGGAVITQTGTAVPAMDGSLFSTFGWGHQTRPQSNTITTGTTALAVDSYTGAMGIQKNFITGTGLTVTWNNQHITSNNPRSDINPTNSSNLQLQLTQRLTQGFSLAVNNRNIRIARNNLKASELTFRLQVMSTVASIIGLYYDLVSLNENYRVRQKALEVAGKFLSDNRKQVEIGTLAPIEIVRAEANVATAQQDLTNSETALLQQEAILKSALSKNGIASPSLKSARVVPTDRLPEPADVALANLDELVELALRDRPEILQTRINLANSKIGMEGSKNALLPALDFQASFQNNGMAGSRNFLLAPGVLGGADPFFLGGWSSAVAQVLRRNFPDYSIGFQLNVPLRNRTAQADYQRDMLSLRQAEIGQQKQINDLRVSVQNALTALTQARAAYAAAQKARVLQEQTLDAENKKYVLGASTAFLVVQTQRDLATAQYNEVAARNTFNRAKVNIDLVTAQLLDRYGVQIEDAKKGVSSRPAGAAQGDD